MQRKRIEKGERPAPDESYAAISGDRGRRRIHRARRSVFRCLNAAASRRSRRCSNVSRRYDARGFLYLANPRQKAVKYGRDAVAFCESHCREIKYSYCSNTEGERRERASVARKRQGQRETSEEAKSITRN